MLKSTTSALKSTLLVINSKDRAPDSVSASNFSYSIGQSLDVQSVTIKSISIPVTQYNIQPDSTKLNIVINSVFYQFVIPVGQYSVTEVIVKLQTYINSLGVVTCTISQNPNTFKIEIVSNVSINFVLPFYTTNPTPLGPMLGLPKNTTISGYTLFPNSSSLSYSLPNIPAFQGLMNYYILTRILSEGSNGIFANGLLDALQTNVPIDVSFGKVQNYRPYLLENNTITFIRPINIQYIDIRIVDKDLKVVDLNGQNVELVYKLVLN